MSRYASGGRNTNANVGLAICSTILNKESQYRKGTATNHTLTKMAATRLMPGTDGGLENALLNLLNNDKEGGASEEEKSELQDFLTEQRTKLQEVSLRTVQAEMETDAFLASIRSIREQLLAQADQESSDETESTDYNALMSDLMDKSKAELMAKNPPEQNEKYQDICEMLGIQVERKRTLNGDDDEIEVTGTQSGTQSAKNRLKCPILAKEMEDPVKNKLCGHVYSRTGIEQMIKSRQARGATCQCPIPGCSNRNVTLDQLEEDLETRLLIQRARRQNEATQQQKSQNATTLVDSDDEE